MIQVNGIKLKNTKGLLCPEEKAQQVPQVPTFIVLNCNESNNALFSQKECAVDSKCLGVSEPALKKEKTV